MAPRDPRVWPLKAREGLTKCLRDPLSPQACFYAKILKVPKKSLPDVNIDEQSPEVVDEVKLLGLVISSVLRILKVYAIRVTADFGADIDYQRSV